MPRNAGDRPVALARPVKAPLPNLWRTCGRRERGTDARESAWSNLRRRAPCSWRWKASRSAGWRCPSRDAVGRQASVGPYVGSGSPPLSTHAPMTADVQRTPRKGTTSACALRSACTGREKLRASPVTAVDASFARSSDPCTSSPLQLRRGNPRRWRGRVDIAVGKTWRKPGGTGTGIEANGRCAARRVYTAPQGGSVARQKRKDVTASVPARITRARSRVPVRRSSCRNRQATSGPKYARQTRSQKSGQGRVNRGLGRCERRRSHVGERLERNGESRLGSLRTTSGARSGKGPG